MNVLGHIIVPNQLYTDTAKVEEAFTLRKRMTKAIARCRKNPRLTILGRANAAKALAVTHIDPSIHYPIKKKQTLEAQKIYNNYVIGTSKLGAEESKYLNIASGINITEYCNSKFPS